MDQVRAPRSTEDFALSAGETLTRWHLHTTGSQDRIQEPDWQRAAYMVAAALYAVAVDTGLQGGQITGAGLDLVLAVIEQRPASAIDAFPGGAFASMGEQLLATFDTPAFEQVQHRAGDILQHHLDDVGDRAATLGSRSAVLARALREQGFQRLAEALGTED
jgi:hypothetical protein